METILKQNFGGKTKSITVFLKVAYLTIDHIRNLSIGLETSLQWRLIRGNILKIICI